MTHRAIPSRLRQAVAHKSRFRCAYCQTQQIVVGTQLTVDHIVPKLLGGTDDLSNLCLACWDCNLSKQVRIGGRDPVTGVRVPLFRPNHDQWADNFRWSDGGRTIVGATASGRATVALLRLNRPALVQASARWIAAGWHPPPE